jgi:hypothetical protein
MSLKKTATRGRPPLPKEVVCDHRVVTFLNDGTRRRVDELATRNGNSISQTCRDLIVRAIESIEHENKKDISLKERSE